MDTSVQEYLKCMLKMVLPLENKKTLCDEFKDKSILFLKIAISGKLDVRSASDHISKRVPNMYQNSECNFHTETYKLS